MKLRVLKLVKMFHGQRKTSPFLLEILGLVANLKAKILFFFSASVGEHIMAHIL